MPYDEFEGIHRSRFSFSFFFLPEYACNFQKLENFEDSFLRTVEVVYFLMHGI